MKSKSVNDGVERTFVLSLDQGKEAFKSIIDFTEREKITGTSVSGIGSIEGMYCGPMILPSSKLYWKTPVWPGKRR